MLEILKKHCVKNSLDLRDFANQGCFYSRVIKMPFAAKKLDETSAFFENVVYNVSNKSAVCGKNIRWRLLWR